MAYDVTLITGDGTGPELADAARKCVDATGVKINWDVQEAGIDVMERLGRRFRIVPLSRFVAPSALSRPR